MRTNKFFTCVLCYLHVCVCGCEVVSAAMSAKCGRVNEIKVENRKQNTQHKRLRRIQNNQLKRIVGRTRGQSVIGINKLWRQNHPDWIKNETQKGQNCICKMDVEFYYLNWEHKLNISKHACITNIFVGSSSKVGFWTIFFVNTFETMAPVTLFCKSVVSRQLNFKFKAVVYYFLTFKRQFAVFKCVET